MSANELAAIRSATVRVLEQGGVSFPSEKSECVSGEHGAQVDVEAQIVRLSPDLVAEAMSHVPRACTLAGRAEGADLFLDGTSSQFRTDGIGMLTVDFETGEQRHLCKDDVAKLAMELVIFTAIAVAHGTLEQPAAVIEFSQRCTRILLDALCPLGLLRKSEGVYALTRTAETFPVRGRRASCANACLSFWRDSDHLAEAVRTGEATLDVSGP